MGTMTVSDRLRIMLKMPPFQPGGRHADLACDLGHLRIHGIKRSRKGLQMMPSIRTPLNHSSSQSIIKRQHLLSRAAPVSGGGAAVYFRIGLAEQAGEQRDKNAANQGNAAARHELFHALAFCLCVIKKQ